MKKRTNSVTFLSSTDNSSIASTLSKSPRLSIAANFQTSQRPQSGSLHSSQLKSSRSMRETPSISEKGSNYTNQLEEIIVRKNQEIEQLKHMNLFLEQAMKKREGIASAYFEENSKLKETIKIKDKHISALKAAPRASCRCPDLLPALLLNRSYPSYPKHSITF